MYELTSIDGFRFLAEHKEGLGWFDLYGYKINEEMIVWCVEI